MLNKRNIKVGRSYVNEDVHIAREVVEEIEHRKIKYNAFDLTDGQLIPAVQQICKKSELAHWADREANPDEISIIHPFEQRSWFEELPRREIKSTELELTKATLQQVVGYKNMHRL